MPSDTLTSGANCTGALPHPVRTLEQLVWTAFDQHRLTGIEVLRDIYTPVRAPHASLGHEDIAVRLGRRGDTTDGGQLAEECIVLVCTYIRVVVGEVDVIGRHFDGFVSGTDEIFRQK